MALVEAEDMFESDATFEIGGYRILMGAASEDVNGILETFEVDTPSKAPFMAKLFAPKLVQSQILTKEEEEEKKAKPKGKGAKKAEPEVPKELPKDLPTDYIDFHFQCTTKPSSSQVRRRSECVFDILIS